MNTHHPLFHLKNMSDKIVVSAEHVRKIYAQRTVLTDTSLNVHRGEAVALVGENGCGKSTMLRLLCGATRPDSGTVTMAHGIRAALIPDRFEKINMSTARFIEHMRSLENADVKTAEHYCEMFSMTPYLDTPLKYLSKGMLQKVAVIQALLGERTVLFMDEPLAGQDAISQLRFADEIRCRKRDGMAVIMACHEPFLIEALVDRVLQIKDGVLIDGTDYLTQSASPRCMILAMPDGVDIDALVRDMPLTADISPCGQLSRIEADSFLGPALLSLLLEHGIRIVKYEEMQ